METEFIHYIEHAGFWLEGKKVNVFIDPFKISKMYAKADVIFITHPHFDHLDVESIKKIADKKTKFIVAAGADEKLREYDVHVVKPGSSGIAAGIAYEAVPAYNNKKDRLEFHPKINEWLGYIITLDGKTIYHAGDTDLIDEMSAIEVDAAMLPIGGTYTMDVDDAIKAASKIKAGVYIPMHYKAVLGNKNALISERHFAENVKNVLILKEMQEPAYTL
jgi:L-ascorbate metabolism protein UlaG (beta-lactamase superfamily)